MTARTPRRFYLLLFFIFLIRPAGFAFAQEVVIEASTIDEEKIEPSRSTSIVTEQEIRAKKAETVADLLRDIPGVEVVRQGGIGQTTSVFIRGARSEDTLVLIDGMEANDAMSPGCGFDFSSLSPDNITRIEVYLGPQSVRFGAGALGGVINIVTKEGKGLPLTSYLVEGGSYQTARATLGKSGKLGAFNYSVGFDGSSTQGFPAADARDGNSDPDGAKVQSASMKVGWQPNASESIQATLRYTNADVEIDAHGGPGGDDPNDTSHAKQLITGLSGSHRFFEDRLKSTLGFYYSEVDRNDRNFPDTNNPTNSADQFLSENRKIQSDNELTLGEYQTVRAGLQWRDESGAADSFYNGTETFTARKEQSVTGESLTYLFESSTWFFDVGAREDQSSTVGSITSYRASFGRQFPDSHTKAFVSYGTGFKLPSLFQLYSSYGDINLQEEQSNTVEATVEQKIGESVFSTVTFFENNFRNLIDYDLATNKYFNISNAQSRGFEWQSKVKLNSFFDMAASYTYTETVDESTGLSLLRRPLNAWAMSANYRADAYEAFVQYRFKGSRTDVNPTTFQRITDGSYDLVNIGGSYRFSPMIKAHARIENLFNRSYEEVAGYGTAGISFYVGLSGDI